MSNNNSDFGFNNTNCTKFQWVFIPFIERTLESILQILHRADGHGHRAQEPQHYLKQNNKVSVIVNLHVIQGGVTSS